MSNEFKSPLQELIDKLESSGDYKNMDTHVVFTMNEAIRTHMRSFELEKQKKAALSEKEAGEMFVNA